MESQTPVPVPGASPLPQRDARGFDPSLYAWIPVRRKPRRDGWTAHRQRAFIEALADCGSVAEASRAVDMSVMSCYRLRRAPDAIGFAAAWNSAMEQATRRLVDVAFERAIDGVRVPIVNANGITIGSRQKYNDRLLMFLLRAHFPERYRFASREVRMADEPAPPAPLPPVAPLIEAMAPVRPAAPHRLMEETQLAKLLAEADALDGELPEIWRDDGDYELPEPDPVFETLITAAKAEADKSERNFRALFEDVLARKAVEEAEDVDRDEDNGEDEDMYCGADPDDDASPELPPFSEIAAAAAADPVAASSLLHAALAQDNPGMVAALRAEFADRMPGLPPQRIFRPRDAMPDGSDDDQEYAALRGVRP